MLLSGDSILLTECVWVEHKVGSVASMKQSQSRYTNYNKLNMNEYQFNIYE